MATVNRELAILGTLVLRARKAWEVATAEPDRGPHEQADPAIRRRCLSSDEEDALLEALDPDLAPTREPAGSSPDRFP